MRIRFVITLDSDTQLPMGSARRLVGLLAHPLNRAVFDADTGRVVAGYTIVQPRIEASPSGSRDTRFARMFSGDIGFDIYTHAVSELYQDLFGSGIYVGKGIYDVDAFMRSVQGAFPKTRWSVTICSKACTDARRSPRTSSCSKSYPSNYAAYAKRMHRWVRGDWQLVPWLFPTVPSERGARLRNKLTQVDRWKILDNLRRSGVSPMLCSAVRTGLDVAAGRSTALDARTLGSCSLRRSSRSCSIASDASQLSHAACSRSFFWHSRRRGDRCDRARGRQDRDHAQAPVAMDERGIHRARSGERSRSVRCSGGRCSSPRCSRS